MHGDHGNFLQFVDPVSAEEAYIHEHVYKVVPVEDDNIDLPTHRVVDNQDAPAISSEAQALVWDLLCISKGLHTTQPESVKEYLVKHQKWSACVDALVKEILERMEWDVLMREEGKEVVRDYISSMFKLDFKPNFWTRSVDPSVD